MIIFPCFILFFIPFAKAGINITLYVWLGFWIIGRIIRGLKEYAQSRKIKSFFSTFVLPSTCLNKPIFIFLLICIISTLLSVNPALSFRGFWGKTVSYVALFFLVAELFTKINNGARNTRWLTRTFLFSIILIEFNAFFQVITGRDFLRGYTWEGRVQGSFATSNGLSAWLIIVIPILVSIALLFYSKVRNNRSALIFTILSVVLLIPSLILLVMTGSRGAYLGLIFGLFLSTLVGIMTHFKIIRSYFLFYSILLLCFVIGGISFSQVMKYRFSTLMSYTSLLDTGGERRILWREAVNIIKDRPLFGTGPNTYSYIAKDYKLSEKGGIYPHNSFLHMGAEIGALGLFSFLFLLWKFYRVCLLGILKKGKVLLLGLLVSITGFLVQSFFDTHLFSLQHIIFFWFILGFTVSIADSCFE